MIEPSAWRAASPSRTGIIARRIDLAFSYAARALDLFGEGLCRRTGPGQQQVVPILPRKGQSQYAGHAPCFSASDFTGAVTSCTIKSAFLIRSARRLPASSDFDQAWTDSSSLCRSAPTWGRRRPASSEHTDPAPARREYRPADSAFRPWPPSKRQAPLCYQTASISRWDRLKIKGAEPVWRFNPLPSKNRETNGQGVRNSDRSRVEQAVSKIKCRQFLFHASRKTPGSRKDPPLIQVCRCSAHCVIPVEFFRFVLSLQNQGRHR
jgi:hypothetical protein